MIHLGPLRAGCLHSDGTALVYRPVRGEGPDQPITVAEGDRLIALAPWNHATPAALHACWRRSIDVCLVRGAMITPLRSVGGPDPARLYLRRVQHRRHTSERWRVTLARSLVDAKTLAQQQTIAQYRRREGLAALEPIITAIAADRVALGRHDSAESLRGAEGHAAMLAWQAIPILTGVAGFRRQPRTAADPLNLLFDCAYSWLTQLMALHLLELGADLGLGTLHSDADRRPTLALDLIEPLRPIIADRFVLAAWREGRNRDAWFRPAIDRPGLDFTPAGRSTINQRWRTWIFGGPRRAGQYGRVVATARRWSWTLLRGGPWPAWQHLHDPVPDPLGQDRSTRLAHGNRRRPA